MNFPMIPCYPLPGGSWWGSEAPEASLGADAVADPGGTERPAPWSRRRERHVSRGLTAEVMGSGAGLPGAGAQRQRGARPEGQPGERAGEVQDDLAGGDGDAGRDLDQPLAERAHLEAGA